jgi:hypothetical protein
MRLRIALWLVVSLCWEMSFGIAVIGEQWFLAAMSAGLATYSLLLLGNLVYRLGYSRGRSSGRAETEKPLVPFDEFGDDVEEDALP